MIDNTTHLIGTDWSTEQADATYYWIQLANHKVAFCKGTRVHCNPNAVMLGVDV